MKKLILSVAFVAMGTFAMAQQMQKMQKMDPAQMEQKRMDKLKMMQADLNLTDAQVDQIKMVQDQKMAEMKKNTPQRQAERKAKMDQWQMEQNEYSKEMKQILTPDQYTKWQAQKQTQMQNRGKMMKGKKMTKMQQAN
ncbi:hypothetical protein Q73A0000_10225 [Kaistella flava (ex Peng et al. 2021)]|uniref:LTXXQ motif family protein n=1 Tax=Kaistella flava (ex Peng et al. 2021) TaxID=2038776 RepID=A0A7M2Y9G2_9FLAO|nr:hypothetical protein [Kaistella flava (ex Peng et al. 2021)]QOW10720.1 hypothetical protein Q73A0000_10225 [Kaistella flava (ex Peng et al. 2021)]